MPDRSLRAIFNNTFLRPTAFLAIPASLALHFVIMLCFAFRWDKVSAITIIPFSAWTAIGTALAIYGYLVLRWKQTLFLALIWGGSAVICADETRGLARSFSELPTPGTATAVDGELPLRVLTINCGSFVNRAAAAREIEAYKPDVVFFQESPHYRFLQNMTDRMFGRDGAFIYDFDCSIAARGKLTKTSAMRHGNWLQATLTLAGGRQIELLNVHLDQAVTDLKLWRKSTWKHHYYSRRARRLELSTAVNNLLRTGAPRPAIVAGDFNAPASDAVFRQLERHFSDTYARAGSGWPNTFSNSLPLLRIDQIWTTPEFAPVRHSATKSSHSDHRFVICDMIF